MLHPEEADAVGAGRGGAFGGLRDGDVHLDLRRRHGLDGVFGRASSTGSRSSASSSGRPSRDAAAVAVERDELLVLERRRGVAAADDGGDAEFAGDDGGVRLVMPPSSVAIPAARFIAGTMSGRRHLGDDDVAVTDLVELVEFIDDADRTRDDSGARAEARDEGS